MERRLALTKRIAREMDGTGRDGTLVLASTNPVC
jgi:hypothetical protein